MKQKLYFLIFLGIFSFSSFAQKDSSSVIEKTIIYLRDWDARYKIPGTPANFKNERIFEFQFAVNSGDLSGLFDNYSDFKTKLSSSDTIASFDFIREINALVEFVFSDGKVEEVSFDAEGNYANDGKWYKCNYSFYYSLFRFFSNDIVPNKTLNKAKRHAVIGFW